MIELREATSDADLEEWRRVRVSVLPDERAPTLQELRAWGRFLLVAWLDGKLAGSGMAGASDSPGRGFVAPRVLPEARRRGVGTTLLRALAVRLEGDGFALAGASIADPGSFGFAQRFGFEEVNREVEQVRLIAEEQAPRLPPGVEIVSVAERPQLWRRVHKELAAQAFEDMAFPEPLEVPLERWEGTEWISWPEATFVALASDEVVGTAGLQRDADRPDRAENGLTAVRRDWRGRGVASALKRTTLAFAAVNGIREVFTWTQRGNGDMRRLNEHLGYETRSENILLLGKLPLP